YAPPIIAGILLGSIPLTFLVFWARALRRHTTPPRTTWLTVLLSATMLSLTFLELHFRAGRVPGDLLFRDAVTGLGTFFVVLVGVGSPILIRLARSMPATTKVEREAWLDQNSQDAAKWIVGIHVFIFVTVIAMVVALIWQTVWRSTR